ncbi:hypothetical protein BDA96_03G128900 [Sorghum bicolor]|uniref:Uncharacterized protein n=1 Tax=Sorghum bicolor TaxID=4558 RepID=A0A921RBM9_SORBI|nr:hypothetical protein BDA96_03G128900 [Sorghum bicolor]
MKTEQHRQVGGSGMSKYSTPVWCHCRIVGSSHVFQLLVPWCMHVTDTKARYRHGNGTRQKEVDYGVLARLNLSTKLIQEPPSLTLVRSVMTLLPGLDTSRDGWQQCRVRETGICPSSSPNGRRGDRGNETMGASMHFWSRPDGDTGGREAEARERTATIPRPTAPLATKLLQVLHRIAQL